MSEGGINSPSTLYDSPLAYDAPAAYDGGSIITTKTLAELRADLMALLGFAAMAATPPPGMVTLLNLWLNLAQSQQYYRYDVLRNEQWWSWQLAAGERFYHVPVDGTKQLNFRKITWAGISDNGGVAYERWTENTPLTAGSYILALGFDSPVYEVTTAGTTGATEPAWSTTIGDTVTDGTVTYAVRARPQATWSTLVQGIDPVMYSDNSRSMPTHFDVREYLEVWPTPGQPYVVWVKGHMGLKRFTDDAHETTIDPEIVLLFAAAMGKAHYRQPDANNYAQMCARMSAELTAASHGVRRYIPRPSTLGMVDGGAGDFLPLRQPRATWR